jgi:HAMP domain-containing protein
MPSDVLLLSVTAVLAVVALVAAVVALRASRVVLRERRRVDGASPEATPPRATPAPVASVTSIPERGADRRPDRGAEIAPRVVEGRVVIPPSRDEVVATALSRPQTRIVVIAHGLARALRPESRDRIAALMRREYRDRRRSRLRAGRRAARAAHTVPTDPADRWLGELPAEPGDERAIGA